jgi:hypothetical protein
VNLFRLHPIESGASISNRNRIMTGVKFLLRVTLEPPVDISVRQQRHLAFIHRPRTNKLIGHNQCA